MVTKNVIQEDEYGFRRVRKAENALTRYNARSADPSDIALRTKVDDLQQRRVSLVALLITSTLSSISPCTCVILSSLFITCGAHGAFLGSAQGLSTLNTLPCGSPHCVHLLYEQPPYTYLVSCMV